MIFLSAAHTSYLAASSYAVLLGPWSLVFWPPPVRCGVVFFGLFFFLVCSKYIDINIPTFYFASFNRSVANGNREAELSSTKSIWSLISIDRFPPRDRSAY